MSQTITNHGHEDMIHDAQLDYYGRRLATCSSDRTIRIFDIDPTTNSHTLQTTLKGHEAPIFALAWAHPKYGAILASSSYDGKVIIWRESAAPGAGGAQWARLVDFALHTASVNGIAWSPHELGAHLACASSDGSVSVLSFNDTPATQQPAQNAWSTTIIPAHPISTNAISWAPSLLPGTLEKAATSATVGQSQGGERRFVTGGSDGSVKLWHYNPSSASYDQTVELKGHSDWVRDVAWSPSLLSKTYIASGSQDKSVRIWTFNGGEGEIGVEGAWQCSELKFECAIWRVSWSLTGNVLAVSGGDNKVSLWKERVRDGGWECVRTLEE